MTNYRGYLLDPKQRVVGYRDFEADGDMEAIGIMNGLALQDDARGFELWEGMRRVLYEVFA